MTRRGFVSSFRSFIEVSACLISASAALESGKRPSPQALKRLGLDPQQFSHIIRR